MSAFSYVINTDGIAVLTFDLPGEKVNKLTASVMAELDALLDELAAKKEIKALVFRSGKKESFIAGADIGEIRDIADAGKGERLARHGQATLSKLEALPFPTVAAIHGPCMGGGLELALACTYRVISNDQRTALALPEVRLGIIPGFGGTQRLPRLVGLANAIDMILSGKSVYPKQARKIGLADEVTYRETLLSVALATAKKAIGRPRPARVRTSHPLTNRLIEGSPLTRPLVYRMARKSALKETRGNYPAPLAALESIRYGMAHGKEAGYVNEAKMIGRLAPTEVTKNLISVFYLNETLKRDPHPSHYGISRAGVLGAGVMGGGIAQLLAERGVAVRMKDVSTKAVGAGLKEAWQIFSKRQKKGILTALQARDGFDRITGAADYTGFGTADLAVEAVVEDMNIKKNVLRDFEAVAREDAIFASNTSSLSITEMATASKRPDRVVGMHFFNPVERMPLVEVVRGEKTSDPTVSAIATLSRKLGKLPVVVNDGPGFLVNRILMPYLGEAVAMLEQGAAIEEIDWALLQFGMPMGAFILLDEIGIDIAHKVSEILHQGLGARVRPSGLLGALYRDGYYGRKNGRGFYEYQGGRRVGPDISLARRISAEARGKERIGPEEVVDRAILRMIKEAALCLEDKIVDRPDLLDAALIFGIGFPPFRGGLLKYADMIGSKIIVEKLEGNAKKHGERFEPPRCLVEMAKGGKGFYA
ncbi:MAG TPA: 3-hydroxyacyl-CoA dehydrogenase NAD-binding domain-containing protein [Bacteroidota bacterium]|nr:3-hydroxyacyl-CoA dehydrogenase NAD-binding domain-containing protein [Bacteroidota bacterium]HXY55369.1 3-hydroxyacyl-CoA dehydrogenase NAD-binding domain-containing protein [Nitrospirota bacterium]